MIYFTADPHFGHSNIIDFCDRPFADVDEMDKVLVRSWNARVHQDDSVYVLGDMFYHCEREHAEDILSRLKGRKHLIIGNHDGSWMTKVDAGRYFESVDYMTEINDGHRVLVLCHYPLLTWRREKKTYMIYGHIHNDTSQDFWPLIVAREHMLNAGVEINNYMPVTFEELVADNARFKELMGGGSGRKQYLRISGTSCGAFLDGE